MKGSDALQGFVLLLQQQIALAGETFKCFEPRLDIFLPAGFEPRVSVGQTAIAGETVLAEFGSAKGPVLSRRG